MPFGFELLTVGLLGLCLGSFATALSWRLPRGVSMIAKAHSACPCCGHDLGIPDLVPVFSWLFLKGRCRFCRAPIGARYPLIELATVALCFAFYAAYGFTPSGFVLFMLAPVLVSIVDIDLHHKIIPDSLNIAVAAAGFALLLLAGDMNALTPALGGAALYACAAWLLRFVFMKAMKREPMGLGDVKFFGAAGVWLGLDPDNAALFMILAGASGVVLALVWKKIVKEAEFPFGPALVLALIAVLLKAQPFLP